MKSKTIILDVDVPMADSNNAWLKWLESITGVTLDTHPTDYDMTVYFKEELEKVGMTGFEFWKGEDIYRNVDVTEGAVNGCEVLSCMGYRILPVTKVFTEHTNSKRKWLSKNFPMVDEPIYISQYGSKADVRGDYIIDDRKDNFIGFEYPTKGVLFNSPYSQYTSNNKIDIPYQVMDTWGQIIDYFMEEL